MNGVHDMGGMHGFGTVESEGGEPVFHAPWEGRVMAMNRAMGFLGLWTIDAARFGREALPPATYLSSSYYERWTFALENQCVEHGLINTDELAAGHALRPALPASALTADKVPASLTRGNFERQASMPARFAPGDRVRTCKINPPGHTRLPRYARGRFGVVDSIRGCMVYPDAAAVGERGIAHWLYTVVFDARELWGDAADPTLTVSIDAWEPYLEVTET